MHDAEVRELERKAALGDREAAVRLEAVERRVQADALTGLLEVLTPGGHVEIRWSKYDPSDVVHVRGIVDVLRRSSYRLYVRREDGTDELADGFDPAAGRYVIAPPLQGG